MPVFPLITRPLTLNQGGDLKKGMVMVLVVGMFLVASVVSAQMGPVFAKGKGQFALGLDHTINVTDKLGLYLGPGFEFASAKSSVDDAAFSGINDDNPRATSFSLDGRIGVIAKVGKSFGLNGSMGKKFCYVKSSFKSDFGFGSEDVSFSRWLSSVNGWAGFVILFYNSRYLKNKNPPRP